MKTFIRVPNNGESYFVNFWVIPSVSACPGVEIKSLEDSCFTRSDEPSFEEEFAWKLWLYLSQDVNFDFADEYNECMEENNKSETIGEKHLVKKK